METEQMPLLTQLRWIVLRYRFIILALLACFIGFLLIAFAEATPFREIARDFGVAFFTVGTIGLALEFYTRKQFQELVADRMAAVVEASSLSSRLDVLRDLVCLGNDLRSLGVKQIHKDRTEIKFLEHLGEPQRESEIRILGTALMGFANWQIQQTIERRLEAGCKIKLLALDPESKFMEQRAKEENRSYEAIKTDIVSTSRMINGFINEGLPSRLRENIAFRNYDAAPAYFIFSTGSIMIAGFYLRGKRGEFFPHLELEIREGGIYKAFLEHFDALWLASEKRDSQEPHGS